MSMKNFKVILPHFLLTILIALYLMMGAFVFQVIETKNDVKVLEDKANKIVAIYKSITSEFDDLCSASTSSELVTIHKSIMNTLSLISEVHEGRKYKVDLQDPNTASSLVKHRWSYIDAFLYSLSILTTTGYTNAAPLTKSGQIFAVVYGLVGIPLMVLMAVDIGRFMSDTVLICYCKLMPWLSILMKICFVSKEKSIIAGSNTEKDKLAKLPLWAVFVVFLLFNVLGAFVYMIQERSHQNFLKAFFICFNLMVNLTMGEIPFAVDNIPMVIYIVIFVTSGLAVLSMCADLAVSELKWLFLKIHYFGRKIKETRIGLHSLEEKEVKELLKIINEIRLQEPLKEEITRQDIINYIQSKFESNKNGDCAQMSDWKDKCAFMPKGMEVLRYVDAEDMEVASMRKIPSVAVIAVEPFKIDAK